MLQLHVIPLGYRVCSAASSPLTTGCQYRFELADKSARDPGTGRIDAGTSTSYAKI
jgi:hypothetical protein